MIYIICTPSNLIPWEKVEDELIKFLNKQPVKMAISRNKEEIEENFTNLKTYIQNLPEKTETDRILKAMISSQDDEIRTLPEFLKLYTDNPKELMDKIVKKIKANSND